jgi:hypothetical protein
MKALVPAKGWAISLETLLESDWKSACESRARKSLTERTVLSDGTECASRSSATLAEVFGEFLQLQSKRQGIIRVIRGVTVASPIPSEKVTPAGHKGLQPAQPSHFGFKHQISFQSKFSHNTWKDRLLFVAAILKMTLRSTSGTGNTLGQVKVVSCSSHGLTMDLGASTSTKLKSPSSAALFADWSMGEIGYSFHVVTESREWQCET